MDKEIKQKLLDSVQSGLAKLAGDKRAARELELRQLLMEMVADLKIVGKKPNWLLWIQIANLIEKMVELFLK